MGFALVGSKIRLTKPDSGESLCAVVRQEIGDQLVVDVGDRSKTFLGLVEVECFNDSEHIWFEGLAIATLSTFIVVRPTSQSQSVPRKHRLHMLEEPLDGDLVIGDKELPITVVAVAPTALATKGYEAIGMETEAEITVNWMGDKIKLVVVLEAQTVDTDSVESVASIRRMSRVSRAVWTRLTEQATLPELAKEPPPSGSRIRRDQSA